MQRTTEVESDRASSAPADSSSGARLIIALVAFAVVLAVLYAGFIFLRNGTSSQILTAVVAIVWGVGGVAALFTTANMLVEALPDAWTQRLQPYVFVGPAVGLLGLFLFIPALLTLYQSFYGPSSDVFVGANNYINVFSNRQMLESFRNNVLWLVLGTGLCVALGLLIAILADRSKFETIAKSLVFMPLAISFVGAGIIFRFIYSYAPPGETQIGLLNAIVTNLGGEPQAWLTSQPWNNLFLIAVLVWMQTGFAMVILSAALKGVPEDLLEAARVDGATEVHAFFSIIVPYIQGTIITVTTTVAIFTLKIFDVVIVMTGGQYGTEVVATQFYRQFFSSRNYGYGAAIAIVLFLAVLPVMFYNLRQLRTQEGF